MRHLALSIFMDAFQGSYKYKPFYLHSIPAIYFIAQFTNLLILATFGIKLYHATSSFNLMVIIILIAIARPYKNKWHNVTALHFSVQFFLMSRFALCLRYILI